MDSFVTKATIKSDGNPDVPVAIDVSPGRLRLHSDSYEIGRWTNAEAGVSVVNGMLVIEAEGERLLLETLLREMVASLFNSSEKPQPPAVRATTSQDNGPSETSRGSDQRRSGLSGLFRMIAVAAFIFPFMTVSCLGEPIGTATGVQLAFGLDAQLNEEITGPMSDLGSLEDQDLGFDAQNGELDLEIPVLAALVLLVAATGLSFLGSSWWPSILSCLAVALLAYWWFDLSSTMEGGAAIGLVVESRFGIWLSSIATIGSVTVDVMADGLRRPTA